MSWMTLNDIFKSVKNKIIQNNITHDERYKLSKIMGATTTPTENPVLRTANNQALYTADGEPIRTLQ